MTKAEALEAVETNVGQRIRLSEYRSTVTLLSEAEREQVIDQAQLMLEQVFVHLPLKRAMHGTEPIQRLRLLKLRHHAMNERAFQSEMIDIFTDLRDLHTNYVLPQAYWSKFAFTRWSGAHCGTGTTGSRSSTTSRVKRPGGSS